MEQSLLGWHSCSAEGKSKYWLPADDQAVQDGSEGFQDTEESDISGQLERQSLQDSAQQQPRRGIRLTERQVTVPAPTQLKHHNVLSMHVPAAAQSMSTAGSAGGLREPWMHANEGKLLWSTGTSTFWQN